MMEAFAIAETIIQVADPATLVFLTPPVRLYIAYVDQWRCIGYWQSTTGKFEGKKVEVPKPSLVGDLGACHIYRRLSYISALVIAADTE